MLFLAATLLGAPATAGAMSGGNLVVNGDAESPVGSEWTAVQGMGLESFGYGATIPANVLIGGGTYDGGTAALHPRGAGLNPPPPTDPDVTINEQRIVLSAEDAEAVDTGTVRSRFSAYVGGTTNQNDRIGAVAEWRDAVDEPVGSAQPLPEVTNVERGNASGTIFRLNEQAVPAGARSAVVRLTGTRVIVPMHNGYVDNVELRLIGIPRIEKRFAVGPATAGEPFRLTYTVRNSGDLEAKPAWSFRDVLPEGVRVAPAARATTDCPTARISVGSDRISVGGGVVAGQETCTAAVDVVADPGRYVTGPKQFEDVAGLRVGSFTETVVAVDPAPPGPVDPAPPGGGLPVELPPVEIPPFVPPPPPLPAPPPPPAPPIDPWLPPLIRPALRASFDVEGRGAREAGERVTLRLRVSNPTTASASRVRVCVRLPSALRLIESEERAARGGKARGRATARGKATSKQATRSTAKRKAQRRAARSRSNRPCWTIDTLAGDGDWKTTLNVRVARSTGSTVRVRATITSSDTVARATATAKVRTADDEDEDEDREESDDEDADARRR
ncbi:MAG: hypothetical protein ITG02_10630 [Patulibacter sp.]|nr:hypothetical protein [Patulibacter sp.]